MLIPDRPWGPPSLLYNGYWVFPGGKVRPVRAAPLLVPRSWKSRAIPLPNLWVTTGPVTGTLYLYLYVVLMQFRFDKVRSAFSYSCRNALVIDTSLTGPSRNYWYIPHDAPFLHPRKNYHRAAGSWKFLIQDANKILLKWKSAFISTALYVTDTHQFRRVHYCGSLHFHQFVWLLLAACMILKFWKRHAYRALM